MDAPMSSPRERLLVFLQGLTEFKTPVEAISELAKHEKVDDRGSWTEAEMEDELLYWVQLYLTHLGCPLEYTIPLARAICTDVFDGSFRVADFEVPPPQLVDTAAPMDAPDWMSGDQNGHAVSSGDLASGEAGNGDNSHKHKGLVLSAKNLYSHGVVKANELLSRWKMDLPNFEPIPLPHAVSVYATKNKRPGMEDRHVVIPDLRAVVDLKGIKSPVSFYAVYDGHAGPVAASYAAAHLHRRFCTSKHFPDHMEEALKEAFIATDELYSEKGTRDKDYSGTTAVVSVVYENKLYMAWVGDSEAAIVINGHADKLVEPRHVAGDQGERERVQNAGGTVIMNQGGWRVAAVLTVTRAIGDSGFKPFVTASPDVRVVELTGNEDYLIVACDGLWDELTPEGAMNETNRFLVEHPERAMDVSKALSEKARKSGSMDNITVLVIMLKPAEQLIEELKKIGQNSDLANTVRTDEAASLPNSSGSREDEFADLVDATDFVDLDFDPAAQNPFDTTPLDPSVLGDFGTPSDRSSSETGWNFEGNPVDFHAAAEESSALDLLDQAIDDAGVQPSPVKVVHESFGQEFTNFVQQSEDNAVNVDDKHLVQESINVDQKAPDDITKTEFDQDLMNSDHVPVNGTANEPSNETLQNFTSQGESTPLVEHFVLSDFTAKQDVQIPESPHSLLDFGTDEVAPREQKVPSVNSDQEPNSGSVPQPSLQSIPTAGVIAGLVTTGAAAVALHEVSGLKQPSAGKSQPAGKSKIADTKVPVAKPKPSPLSRTEPSFAAKAAKAPKTPVATPDDKRPLASARKAVAGKQEPLAASTSPMTSKHTVKRSTPATSDVQKSDVKEAIGASDSNSAVASGVSSTSHSTPPGISHVKGSPGVNGAAKTKIPLSRTPVGDQHKLPAATPRTAAALQPAKPPLNAARKPASGLTSAKKEPGTESSSSQKPLDGDNKSSNVVHAQNGKPSTSKTATLSSAAKTNGSTKANPPTKPTTLFAAKRLETARSAAKTSQDDHLSAHAHSSDLKTTTVKSTSGVGAKGLEDRKGLGQTPADKKPSPAARTVPGDTGAKRTPTTPTVSQRPPSKPAAPKSAGIKPPSAVAGVSSAPSSTSATKSKLGSSQLARGDGPTKKSGETAKTRPVQKKTSSEKVKEPVNGLPEHAINGNGNGAFLNGEMHDQAAKHGQDGQETVQAEPHHAGEPGNGFEHTMQKRDENVVKV